MKLSELRNERKDLVSNCEGCERAEVDINKCSAYINPAFWWVKGRYCPLSTNNIPEQKKEIVKKVNPLKASKRARRQASKNKK